MPTFLAIGTAHQVLRQSVRRIDIGLWQYVRNGTKVKGLAEGPQLRSSRAFNGSSAISAIDGGVVQSGGPGS